MALISTKLQACFNPTFTIELRELNEGCFKPSEIVQSTRFLNSFVDCLSGIQTANNWTRAVFREKFLYSNNSEMGSQNVLQFTAHFRFECYHIVYWAIALKFAWESDGGMVRFEVLPKGSRWFRDVFRESKPIRNRIAVKHTQLIIHVENWKSFRQRWLKRRMETYPNRFHVLFLNRFGASEKFFLHPLYNVPNGFWRRNDVERRRTRSTLFEITNP